MITEIPQPEGFRSSILIENIQVMDVPSVSDLIRPNSYTVTRTDFDLVCFRGDYLLASDQSELTDLGSKASLIAIANELFANARPLIGKEMEILNNTFSRMRSSVPTKL